MKYQLPKDPEYRARIVMVDKDYTFVKQLALVAKLFDIETAVFLDFQETLNYVSTRKVSTGSIDTTFLIEPVLRNSLLRQDLQEPSGADLISSLYTLGVTPAQITFMSLYSVNELERCLHIFTPTMSKMYQERFHCLKRSKN